ncbi:MAG TPA: outer membrane beta-barrel protein [Flavobacteriales bacterium]|nr:outer membrane beta-barrel protein [Flavobacteriales bacterium]HNU55014.1 outer membrane beta-barrel protein [Flavobacteriales bacterium]
MPVLFRSLISVLLLASAQLAAAQPPAGGRGGRPAIGRIYGKVIDSSTGKAAEFATVSVNAARGDSLLGGTIVRNNGDFLVEQLPLMPLKVTISFIGYKPQVVPVQLTRDQQERDLGNIVLEPDAEVLKEFEVTGEKRTSIMQVDRRVYNVDKDLTTQGASAVEVMKNIPGLSVDVDGNVQMRGSNPQVLIDGRPTTMTLEMIPAEDIERVELITNPSAAFDANTTGGILNVVLKKSTKPGYSGQVQGGIGTNDRYQAGGNLNAKDGRWAFNLSYNFNTSRNNTNALTRRTDRSFGEEIGYFEQDTRSLSGRRMNGGRLGVDWQVSNRSTLTVSNSVRWFTHDGSDDQDFFTLGGSQELLTRGQQLNSSRTDRSNYTGQVLFKHKTPKEGKEWSMDFTYNYGQRESFAEQDLYSYGTDGGSLSGSPRLQDNVGWSHYSSYTFQADVVDPITERTKLEYGLKGNVQPDHTVLEVRLTSPLIGTDVLDTSLSNDYRIQNMVNAAYVNWSQQLTTSWSMMAGLRFEQTWFETRLSGKDEVFRYRYPDGTGNLGRALFPSLYFVRRWEGSEREFQINFSRKINRPRFWQIVPFIMYSDSRNVRIGNPALAPEMSNLAEVNHLLPFLGGKATWLTSVFGRYSTDVVTNFASPLPTDSTILLNTFVNGSFETMLGWENVLKVDPMKGLQITLSGMVRHTNVALSSAQGGLRNQGVVWESKLMVNQRFGVKADWTVQLNGEYESPEVQAQGRSMAQYGVDASLSHDFTKRLTGVLSVNDIFFTRRWGNIIDTPLLFQESYRRREMRFVRFTLTWKFGEQNMSLFRRRGQRSEPGQNGGGEMDF